MASEMMQIDDLLIDKFNPYAVPGLDTFSPGIPKMLGGYKGQSTLTWYEKDSEPSPFKETDKTIACGMPSVGDYSADFCSKPAMVLNNQPGWSMEFDGIDPLIRSDYGLDTYIGSDMEVMRPKCKGKKCEYKIPDNIFFIAVILLALLLFVVLQK